MKRNMMILCIFICVCMISGCRNDGEELGTEVVYLEYEYTFRELPDPVYHEVADAFAGGDGTAQNPYQISTAEELALLSNLLNDYETGKDYEDKNYILTADISLNDTTTAEEWYLAEEIYSWNPIGRGIDFAGVFDGNGYTIYGLYINTNHDGKVDTYDEEYGLFGSLYGTVKNLNIEDAYICVSGNSADVGAIAGHMYFDAKIESCKSSAVLECYDGYYGGIVGSLGEGSVDNCEFTGVITQVKDNAYSILGGIAGYGNGDISNCVNRGQINFTGGNIYSAGGIVGSASEGKISNCQNEGSLNCTMMDDAGLARVGGIAGVIHISTIGGDSGMSRGVIVLNCKNNGTVEGVYKVGGIVGAVSNDHSPYCVTIENCINNGNVAGEDVVAGIIGELNCTGKESDEYNVYIKNCVNNVDIEGNKPGGVIGNLFPNTGKAAIIGCKNVGNITGTELYAAGVICYLMPSYTLDIQLEILSCENAGAITSPKNAGGILCYAATSGILTEIEDTRIRINNCKNAGEIITDGIGFLGGICGCYGMANVPTEFSNCINTGTLSVLTPVADLETFESEKEFTLARCTGGIIGRVGYGIYFTTDTDNGNAENVRKRDAFLNIRNCHNKGQLNVPIKAELYTDFFGGIIGNASGEKEYSFFVEDCTYMHFDRGLGNLEYPNIGEKVVD